MSAPLPPAVFAALAALEATPAPESSRAMRWVALARAWAEAADGGNGGNGGNVGTTDAAAPARSPPPDATECHERSCAAYAEGLREIEALEAGGPRAAALSDAADALSAGRMTALAALAAVPPSAPAPLVGAPSSSSSSSSSPQVERVYVVSDLHVDQPLPWRCGCFAASSSSSPSSSFSSSRTGMDWVCGLAPDPHAALIVAGDVADSLAGTVACLAELRRRFARVFYCPGNHELYLRGPDARAFPDSWCKLFALRRACARLGVETSPAAVAPGVVVAPLPSWYDDGAFCGRAPSSSAASTAPRLRYDASCAWGPVRDDDVHRVMLSLARRELVTAARAAALAGAVARPAGAPQLLLITATHFLPRPELPYHRGVMDAAMGCAVLGSAVLPALAAAVFGGGGGGGGGPAGGKHVHAYGHSHVQCDRDDLGDGVRYVQRSLGGGRSVDAGGGSGGRRLAASACRCFLPLLVWEAAAAAS